MNLDTIDREDLEDWKAHPTTEAILREMDAERLRVLSDLEIRSAGGGDYGAICAIGGKAAQLRSLLRDIANAKGKEPG
jgi:hypothetical protein